MSRSQSACRLYLLSLRSLLRPLTLTVVYYASLMRHSATPAQSAAQLSARLRSALKPIPVTSALTSQVRACLFIADSRSPLHSAHLTSARSAHFFWSHRLRTLRHRHVDTFTCMFAVTYMKLGQYVTVGCSRSII